MRTVEISGIKLEIDERTARTVEQYHVGDRVKVLVKTYSDYKIYPGVIVGFSDFTKLPSIEVMYLSADSWDSEPLKFATLNEKNENVEIAPMNEAEVIFGKDEVIARVDQEIRKRELALFDMQAKRRYFIEKFGAIFADVEEEVEAG